MYRTNMNKLAEHLLNAAKHHRSIGKIEREHQQKVAEIERRHRNEEEQHRQRMSEINRQYAEATCSLL